MRLTFTIHADDKAQGEDVWNIAILDRGFDRQLVECLSVVGTGDVFTFWIRADRAMYYLQIKFSSHKFCTKSWTTQTSYVASLQKM